MQGLTNWQRLRLLTWKNFIILWNNKRDLVFDVCLPVVFWISIIIIRVGVNPRLIPEYIFKPVDLNEAWQNLMNLIKHRRQIMENIDPDFKANTFVPDMVIAYAPSDYKDFEIIMENALEILGEMRLVPYHSCNALQSDMMEFFYFAGVCFHDIVAYDYAADVDISYEFDENDKLDNLNYTIVFPSELRIYDDTIVGFNWLTNQKFGLLSESRLESGDDGGYVGYIREGFIPLQDAIHRGFLKYRLNSIDHIPKVTIQRFPYIEHMYDQMVGTLPLTLCLLIILGFLCPVIRITWRIAREKQTAIKEYMRASGIKSWIYYVSWFVHGLFIFFCIAIILTFILMLRWNLAYSILTKSSLIVVFCFIISYCVYAGAYSILIASVLHSSFLSATVAGSIWIITTVPTIAFAEHREMDTTLRICCYIFPNSAMGLITFRILEDDVFQDGLHINELFSQTYPYEDISVGEVMLIFLGHAIIYVILIIFLEKVKPSYAGTTTTLRTLLNKSAKSDSEEGPVLNTFKPAGTKVFEIEAVYRKQLVAIENLCKSYQNMEVVKNVTLNLYEGNITVLLGHNGSGKTTLLKMIIGVEPFTEGTIAINGEDASLSKDYSPNLGASVRDFLLFDDLTVENQILFYSRLKGMNWKQANLQVDKYCRTMDLTGKRKTISKNLTIGLRHQLAVCCALAGESKIVILDEPNYGMDLRATKQVLQLLETEKKHRTILLSTNSTKIADSIADRVAILSKGEIKCSGSIVFLKNIYSFGQRLYIIKGKECRSSRITEFLQTFIPDIAVESELGHSLNYLINNRYTHMIGAILEGMESEFHNLGIVTYALDDLSIDDVVMSNTNYPDEMDPHRQSRILNGETPYVGAAYEAFNVPYTRVYATGQKFRGIFLTRLIFAWRNKWQTIGHMFLPVYCIILMSAISYKFLKRHQLPTIAYFEETYEKTITITSHVGKLNADMQSVYDNLLEAIFWLKKEHVFIDIGERSIADFAFEKQKEELRLFNREYVAGVAVDNDTVNVYFNNYPYHSAPLALNSAYTAIARTLIDKYSTLTVQMKPLPFQTSVDATLLFRQHDANTSIVLILLLGFLFSWNVSVYYITLERSSRFCLLTQIAGAKLRHYWVSIFIFDILRNIIVFTLMSVGILIYPPDMITYNVIGYTFLTTLLGCITVHSVHYVFARLMKSAIACYNTVLLFDCMGIITFFFMSECGKSYANNPTYKSASEVFVWHPYFSMGSMLQKLYVTDSLHKMCDDPEVRVVAFDIRDNKHPKCDEFPDLLSKEGIATELISMIVSTVLSWLLLIAIEYNRKWLRYWIFSIKSDNSEYAWEDYLRLRKLEEPDDIERERIKLDSKKPAEVQKAALVLNRVGKTFGVFEALHRFCFILDRCNICGVLGSNGSGKSILLDMINTSTRISYGQIIVKGIDVAEQPFSIKNLIGYCPETLNAFEIYTACEIMEIFAMLRGIPLQRISRMCECIAKVLGFFQYYDRLIRTCSLGVQKRISCALAVIGQPDLILMDEPSSAIDTYGKLLLRNVLSRVSRNGSTVVFTSSSPQECQLFCDKLLIIMDGRLISGGSMLDVFSNIDYGYDLIIRVKPLHSVTLSMRRHESVRFTNADGVKLRLIALVQSSFENVVLHHVGELMVSFIVPRSSNVGLIYSTIKANAFSYNIESFGIFRSSMEMIYLQLFHKKIYEYYY